MQTLGVPYSDEEIANARAHMDAQASIIQENLHADPDFVSSYENARKNAKEKGEEFVEMKDREITALIAYLQRLGTDIRVKETAQK